MKWRVAAGRILLAGLIIFGIIQCIFIFWVMLNLPVL